MIEHKKCILLEGSFCNLKFVQKFLKLKVEKRWVWQKYQIDAKQIREYYSRIGGQYYKNEARVSRIKSENASQSKTDWVIKEVTPAHLRCAFGTCPAVYEVDGGILLVVGKKVTPELKEKIQSRVGKDECAILISPEFFSEFQKK